MILITNDDSYEAPGLATLARTVSQHHEVVVVAPERIESGKSQSVVTDVPLKVREIEGTFYRCFAVSGSPTDCVKVGVGLLGFRTPRLVLSGINHGANHSINALYSGTLGAALEAAQLGIPAIAFSYPSHDWNTPLDECAPYILRIVEMVLEKGLPKGIALNVNFPHGKPIAIRATRQGAATWEPIFAEAAGEEGFWNQGRLRNDEPKSGDGDWNMGEAGYITVVPCSVDRTCYPLLEKLEAWAW